ncbi:hypothetical protein FHS16_004581 [Paenibacillus endophyticus]|uniref:Tetratricopeptide repeat protein n=1 Tax=Paenibacillus endophyticus TaxID=1294268 RepID=A0A7W5CCA1_9BACL|nr:hypothetical protein [Paenibacillus endophyticus]MBB3154499.1 hypothetical protein [Paenibacillus endophyticus]
MKRFTLMFLNCVLSGLVIISLLTSCSNGDPYEESMRLGKDALKENQYEVALKQFDYALIEKPSDPDASALFERVQIELSKVEDEKNKTAISMNVQEIEKELYMDLENLFNAMSEDDDLTTNIGFYSDRILSTEIAISKFIDDSSSDNQMLNRAILLSFIQNEFQHIYETIINNPESRYARLRNDIKLKDASLGFKAYKVLISNE